MGLVVPKEGRSCREHSREKIVGNEARPQPRPNRHGPEVPQVPRVDRLKYVPRNTVWLDGRLLGVLHKLDLVLDLVIKVAVDGAGVDGADVDPEVRDLYCDAAGELAHEGLGGSVHDGEGGGNVTSDARGEAYATLELFGDEDPEEVVGDADSGSGVALEVHEVFHLVGGFEETCDYEASVVEDQLDGNVGCLEWGG